MWSQQRRLWCLAAGSRASRLSTPRSCRLPELFDERTPCAAFHRAWACHGGMGSPVCATAWRGVSWQRPVWPTRRRLQTRAPGCGQLPTCRYHATPGSRAIDHMTSTRIRCAPCSAALPSCRALRTSRLRPAAAVPLAHPPAAAPSSLGWPVTSAPASWLPPADGDQRRKQLNVPPEPRQAHAAPARAAPLGPKPAPECVPQSFLPALRSLAPVSRAAQPRQGPLLAMASSSGPNIERVVAEAYVKAAEVVLEARVVGSGKRGPPQAQKRAWVGREQRLWRTALACRCSSSALQPCPVRLHAPAVQLGGG